MCIRDRFVAVHAAVDAEGLRLHERAVLGAGAGVVVQRRALGTERASCVVVAAAVEGDHLRDHLLFALALGFEMCIRDRIKRRRHLV